MNPPRVAVVGTFDVDNYGDHLFPLVAGHELTRRLPGVAVEAWSPYGWLHPTPLDELQPASPLGPWSEARAAAFAARYDTVVVGGGEIIHLNDPLLAPVYGTSGAELAWLAPSRCFVEGLGADRERTCPVIWNAVGLPLAAASGPGDVVARDQSQRLRRALDGRGYVTVRDARSQRRLAEAGVEAPVTVVPDSALVCDRVVPPAALGVALDRLRGQGCYPPEPRRGERGPLVVQGCDLLIPSAPAIAAALRHWLTVSGAGRPVVLLETGRARGDTDFADALAPLLAPQHVWRLAATSTVSDIAAALWGASAFVGSSLHGAITALVHDRPFVVLNLAGEPKLDAFGTLTALAERVVHIASAIPRALDRACAVPVPPLLLADLRARVDEHFDRMAAIVEASAAARAPGGQRLDRQAIEQSAVADLVAWLRTGDRSSDAQRRAALAEARLAAVVASPRSRNPTRARAHRFAARLRRLRP